MAKKSQAETAYSEIKQRIMDKRIVPGQPVFEVELARTLSMGRTPVREAIKRLAAEGHFEVIKGKGTFLRSMTVEQLINCYELSEGLEGMLAFHLAQRRKEGDLADETLDRLEALLDRLDEAAAAEGMLLWVDIDTEFHSALHAACTNPFLRESLDRLQTHFDSVSLFMIPMYFHHDKEKANTEHRDMVRYIREGKPVKARDAAQQQRLRIRKFMIDLTRRNARPARHSSG